MRPKKGPALHDNSRKNAVRERMKTKLRHEQEAARQQQNDKLQLAQELIPTTEQRNQMDYTERNNTVIKMLDNRDKLPKRTQVKIDKFVEDFFTITSEHGMEFNDEKAILPTLP